MAKRRALTELHVALTASTAKFTQKMEGVKRNMTGLEKAMRRTRRRMRALKPAFVAVGAAAGATATAMGVLAGRQLKNIDALAKTADKLGVTTEALAGLRFAAEQTGVASETLDMALQRMTRRIAEAAQGTGEAKNAIAELGLDAAKLARQSPAQSFRDIAESIRTVQNPADRLRIAFKLFDSEGAALVNTLKLGSAGLDQMSAQASRLGLAISRIDAAQIEAANDSMNMMRSAVTGVANRIAIDLAPSLNVIAELVTSIGANSVSSLQQANGELGPISTVIGFIGDSVQALRFGFAKLWEGIYTGLAFVSRWQIQFEQWLSGVLNKIPGVTVELSKFTLAQELNDFAQTGADYWAEVAENAANAESISDRIRKAQADVAKQAAENAKRQAETAAAMERQAAAVGQVVELNRDLDPILASIKARTTMPGMMGPERPDGFTSSAMDASSAMRGGFQIVDNLANLSRGGGGGPSESGAERAIAGLGEKIDALARRVTEGEVRVMLAGLDA